MKEKEPQVSDFTVVVDSNEGAPWAFREMKHWQTKRPLIVPVVKKAMWSMQKQTMEIKGEEYEVGLADYSIAGHEERIQIERKSLSDLFSTLTDRRNRFEAEVARLHETCEYAAVVVESDWPQILRYHEHGPSPQSVMGTVRAWALRYPTVQWWPCPSRGFAEKWTFRLLERFARDHGIKDER